MLIDLHAGSAFVHPVELDQDAEMGSEDLALSYGQDFLEWERPWLERIRRLPTGLSIFSGPTGTGKTTYARSVVDRLAGLDTHCFYYVPANFDGVVKRLLSARYGWDDLPDNILQVLGKETIKREREFNRRAGFTKEDDRIPKWMTEQPLPPHNAVFDVSEEVLDLFFDGIE